MHNKKFISGAVASLALISMLAFAGCSGGMVKKPDPERIACKKSCKSVVDKAVKKCKEQNKADKACELVRETTEKECIKECLEKAE